MFNFEVDLQHVKIIFPFEFLLPICAWLLLLCLQSRFLWEAKEQGDEKLLGQKGDGSAVESMFSVKILCLPEDNYKYAYMFRCCVLFWVTIFMNILCCKDCELSTTFCLHRCWYGKKIWCCDNRLIDHLCVLKFFAEFVLIIVFNSDNVVAIWVKYVLLVHVFYSFYSLILHNACLYLFLLRFENWEAMV